MKIIKITTENEITTLEFPEGDITSVNKRLYEMIGPKCELIELDFIRFQERLTDLRKRKGAAQAF